MKDGIHLTESGKTIVTNNFINYLNNLLRLNKHLIWGIWGSMIMSQHSSHMMQKKKRNI